METIVSPSRARVGFSIINYELDHDSILIIYLVHKLIRVRVRSSGLRVWDFLLLILS